MRFAINHPATKEVIRLVTQPQCGVLVFPRTDEQPLFKLLNELGIEDVTASGDTSNAARASEIAGRLCYLSFANPRPGGVKAYIDNILASAHGSVLEHPNLSFLIWGVSRSLTHELVRHRAGWGYSQVSQRYVDNRYMAFCIPPRLKTPVLEALVADKYGLEGATPEELGYKLPCGKPSEKTLAVGRAWLAGRFEDMREYNFTVEYMADQVTGDMEKTEKRKIARQTSRNCLPNCTETMLVGTANVRAIRHFISQRGSRHADEEIRLLANAILVETRYIAPELLPDYEVDNSIYPPEVRLKHPKV